MGDSHGREALRVLFLEDQPQDIEIIRELLGEAGFGLELDSTENEKEFIMLLRSRRYDVILADFKLPGFDGFAALRWAREICPKVPFICVSGTIGEEKAVEVLKMGAVDYVLKDRLQRLPFAIDRVLAESREKKEKERAQEMFQTLARISPVGIFRTDERGGTTYVNPKWCEISGLTPAQALDHGWLSAIHPDDRERVQGGWKEATRHLRASYSDYRFLRPDGTQSWVMGQATPEIDAEGRIIGYVGTITDISERKRGEELLRSSLQEKEALLKELHHRVKNNLMTIVGLIRIEGEKVGDPDFDGLLRELEGRVRSMALVHESLYKSHDLARIEMQSYIETLGGHIRAQFGARHVAFHVEAAGVEADLDMAASCGLILNELITNAFKHAFPGGRVAGRHARCEIRVSAKRDAGRCELTVADNGVGLPPEVDLGKPATPGLRLVLMLVRQLNGSLKTEREPGTVLRLTLPYLPANG